MKQPIKIIIIDDIEIYRLAVGKFLSLQENFEVVADAKDGEQGIREIQTKKPDVVILDFDLLSQGIQGISLIRKIHSLFPDVKIISDTIKDNPFLLLRIIEEGAAAISAKEQTLLVRAVQAVMNGGHLFPPQYGYETIQAAIEKSILNTLTDTERQYFNLVGSGSDEDPNILAEKLNIKPSYLKNIKTQIKKKLNVKNSDELKTLYKRYYPE